MIKFSECYKMLIPESKPSKLERVVGIIVGILGWAFLISIAIIAFPFIVIHKIVKKEKWYNTEKIIDRVY